MILVFAALLASGCATAGSSPSADDTGVLPIDDVLDSAVVVQPDPSGTTATLTVTTTVPLACAVIFGVDETFGSIATDDDMSGGAHTDHAPVLRGLDPDTDYLYVLQGSDAAGNLYRSEVMSFTTPSGSAIDRPGENVAPTAQISDVSSEFSDAFRAGNAIDGDATSEWSTAGDGDAASITLELPEPTDLVGVGLRTRSMGDGSSIIRRFRVVVDGQRSFGPFDVAANELSIGSFTATAREVRVEAVETTGGNTGAVEIELYAADR